MKRDKIIRDGLIMIILLLCGILVYQQYTINSTRKALTMVVQSNLHSFAGISANTADETYMRQYAYVMTAHEAYVLLSDKSGFINWNEDLSGLLLTISDLMKKDKEKFQRIFSNPEAGELLFQIGDDFMDKDLLREFYEMLKTE